VPSPTGLKTAPSSRTAEERAAVSQLLENPTIAACERFLVQFPEGAHHAEVASLWNELLWTALRDERDPDRLALWITETPGNPHVEEAWRLLETLRWEQLQATPTIALCDRYLEELPDGLHAAEVHRLRNGLEWRATAGARDLATLGAWLEVHPDSLHLPEALELWEELRAAEVLADPSTAACDRYLSELPGGAHAAKVRIHCSEREWSRIEAGRDQAEVERWLAANRDSPHEDEAVGLLEELRFEEVRRTPRPERYRLYLEQYPHGRFTGQVRQLLSQALAWESATEEDTVEGYVALTAKYPHHPLRTEAKTRSSLSHWRRQVEKAPGDGHSWTQLAEACLRQNACTLEDLDRYYRRALELDPRSARALLGLARLRYAEGDYEAAQSLLDESLTLDDGIAATHLYLGRLQVRQENWRQAIHHLDRALALSPDSQEGLFHRAVSKLRVEGCRAALPDLKRIARAAPKPSSKFEILARRYLETCIGGSR